MNKLSYGSFDASNTDIAFASNSGYTNPTSELETRKQLSYPLKELKTFINNTVSVDESDNAIQLVVDNGDLKYRTEPNGALIDLDFTTLLATKQDTLVSGTNIKTINSTSILGSGNIIPFVGMDSASVISTQTENSSGPLTYTATQNCWVYCYFKGHGSVTDYVKIGNQLVHQACDVGGNGIDNTCLVPLCKGQTIELSKGAYHASYDYSYTAYEVKAS